MYLNVLPFSNASDSTSFSEILLFMVMFAHFMREYTIKPNTYHNINPVICSFKVTENKEKQ